MNSELLYIYEREERAHEWAWREALMRIGELAKNDSSLQEATRTAAIALCDPLLQTLTEQEIIARSKTFYASIPDEDKASKWRERELKEYHIAGSSIPYHEEFEEGYAEWVAICPLTHAVDQISRHVVSWDKEYATFFNSIQGGYRYLADTLTEAGDLHPDFNTRSLQRTIEWLDKQAKQFGNPEAEAPALYTTARPVSALRPSSSRVLPASFYDLLSGGFTTQQLDKLLGKEGLNLFDFNLNTATATQKPADWVTIYWALKHKGFIPAGTTAPLAERLIKATFPGTRISITRLNSDKFKGDPGRGNTYYYHVISLL